MKLADVKWHYSMHKYSLQLIIYDFIFISSPPSLSDGSSSSTRSRSSLLGMPMKWLLRTHLRHLTDMMKVDEEFSGLLEVCKAKLSAQRFFLLYNGFLLSVDAHTQHAPYLHTLPIKKSLASPPSFRATVEGGGALILSLESRAWIRGYTQTRQSTPMSKGH